MEKDIHFKFNEGYYYIGKHAKTFQFVEEREKDIYYAYFCDENSGQVEICQCKLFIHKIEINSKFTTKISFKYLIKANDNENQNQIRFDYIAEAFCHFLESHKCPTLIQTSFLFVNEYFKTNIIKDPINPKKKIQIFDFDKNPQIMEQTFPYDNTLKYCTNPLNVFYFIFLILNYPIIFQQAKSYNKLENIKGNLRNLIKIIIYICEKEIRTIDNSLAKLFIQDQIMALENQDKVLFNIVYYLLTNNEIKKMPDLMIYDPCSEIGFLQGIIPKQPNSHNFWAFPAFLNVCNPKLLRERQQQIEFRFLKQQEAIIDSVLTNWESNESSKQGKKKWGFFGGGNKIDFKTDFKYSFYSREETFKSSLEMFNQFIVEITKKPLKKGAKKELALIRSEIKKVSSNITEILKKISEYPYEDLRVSSDDLTNLYRIIYINSDSNPSIFWDVLDESLERDKSKKIVFQTRKDIFDYISGCFQARGK